MCTQKLSQTLALVATQTAFTDTNYTEWFFHIAKPSYATTVILARPMAGLACQKAITPNTVARSLHADDCSIARTLLNPHQHGLAAVSVFLTDKGEQAFQQPIYLERLPVTPRNSRRAYSTQALPAIQHSARLWKPNRRRYMTKQCMSSVETTACHAH